MRNARGDRRGRRAGLCFRAAVALVALVLVQGAWCSPGRAGTDDQSYQALLEWIERNRGAEPAFEAGRRLTLEDREALEPFVPQSAWAYYFFPDMEMEVTATADYPPPAKWGERVQPGYQLDERGVLLGFKGGGYPFPEIEPDDRHAAVKVYWNMHWRPGTYDYVMPMVSWLRSEGGRLDRVLEFTETNSLYANGDHCLVPGYEEVEAKRLMEFRSPRDMAGAKNLTVTYLDHEREDDGWLYLPAQRKPRRVLASERTSELMGMDMIREDMMGFRGKVFEHNWTYLGRKAVLATVNVRDNPELGGPHLWVPNKARWEVRDAHVLLVEPKSASHPYSHKIIFIDARTFWTHWMFAFDRQEKLLRMNQHFLKYSESYEEEEPQQAPYVKQDFAKNLGRRVFIHLGETDINAQKPHATVTHCYVMKKDFSPGRAKQFFSVRNMVSGRR